MSFPALYILGWTTTAEPDLHTWMSVTDWLTRQALNHKVAPLVKPAECWSFPIGCSLSIWISVVLRSQGVLKFIACWEGPASEPAHALPDSDFALGLPWHDCTTVGGLWVHIVVADPTNDEVHDLGAPVVSVMSLWDDVGCSPGGGSAPAAPYKPPTSACAALAASKQRQTVRGHSVGEKTALYAPGGMREREAVKASQITTTLTKHSIQIRS